jgi:molybdenum cofactor synthesis domain-containing protein
MQTAAFIAIGDEILGGKFADENTPFIIGLLRRRGVLLRRAVIIGDTVEEISKEVQLCSERYDLVFTSGGIGPTHDDTTVEAVAAAFGEDLKLFPKVLERIGEKFPNGAPESTRKMAFLPESTEFVRCEGLKHPAMKVRNVYILPGVPSFFRAKMTAMSHLWGGTPLTCMKLRTPKREYEIVEELNEAVNRWGDTQIGSYPRFEAEPFHVIVTIEGVNAETVKECHDWLSRNLEA